MYYYQLSTPLKYFGIHSFKGIELKMIKGRKKTRLQIYDDDI